MRNRTWIVGLVACVAGCFGPGRLVEPEEMMRLPDAGQYRVLGVVTVDTLAVDLDGNGSFDPATERVRLLGIRGPQFDPETEGGEYPAREAISYLQARLVDRWVALDDDRREDGLYRQDPPPEFAVTQDYRQLSEGGPWLAYCYVGDVMVNRDLLEHGFAWVRDDVPCNRMAELRDAEARAKRKGVGVWEFRSK